MRTRMFPLLCLLLVTACGSDDEHHGISRAQLAPRTCSKDIPWLESLMAQTIVPPACAVDADCPCGSHCNAWGSCEAECVTTEHPTYGCTGVDVCDNWGLCTDPSGPPLPEVAPALHVSPLAVTVAGSPPFAETQIDVSLDYAGTSGPAPALAVSGSEERVIVCPGGGQSCTNPTIQLVHELEVKCGASAPWADECQLGAPWTWQPGGAGLVATKPIWVRPKATAHAANWELRITGGGETANDETVIVARATGATQPFDGRYEGLVTLGTDRTLKVDAIASDWGTGELLLIDPSRTLSPNGKLRIQMPGSSLRFNWLSDNDGSMTADLAVFSRTHDPATGTIDATFRLTLPLGGDGRPGTATTQILDGHATLHRSGDNTAPACGTGGTCLLGTSCEYFGKCLPGTTWQSQVTTLPLANGLYDPAIESWSQAVRPQLNALGIAPNLVAQPPDVIERLACFAPDWSKSQHFDGVLKPEKLAIAGNAIGGDLRCASNNAPWVARATIREAAGDTVKTIGGLFTDCLNDLEVAVPASATAADLATNSCISLARLMPGLDLALEGALTPTQSSAREATMAQQLIRNWLQVEGFVASQGEQNVALAGGVRRSPLAPLSRVLDIADAGWKLVLEAPVSETLLSLDPRHLRNPDYRRNAFIAMHWPDVGSADVAGGRLLSVAPSCGSFGEANSCDADQTAVVDPLAVDLSGDASVAFQVDFDAHRPHWNNRYVVDSPGLSVRLSFGGVPYREKGFVRTAPQMISTGAQTWWQCRKDCSKNSACQAWSFVVSPAKLCKLHSSQGDPTPSTGAFSGLIANESHIGTTETTYDLHATDAEYLQGNDLDVVAATSFDKCFDLCSQTSNCAAFTFTGSSCYRKTSAAGMMRWTPGPQSAAMPTIAFDVSHVTTSGKTETVKLFVPRSKLAETLRLNRYVVITRNTADNYYRLYLDGAPVSQARYTQQPGRWSGRYRIGRRDQITVGQYGVELPEFEQAKETGFWATTLDDWEIKAIYDRRAQNEYLSRTRVPAFAPDDEEDQWVGLPVTMLEALDTYHSLLERQLDEVAGETYSVCHGADPGTVEAATARVGAGLRRSLLVDTLAGQLEDRAKQVECDSDAQCTSYSATCGARESHRIDGLGPAVTRSGTMQNCYGPANVEAGTFPAGLCANGSTVVTSPGTVATAAFSVTIAKEGDYAVWGRFWAQSGKQSFWLRVDSQPWQTWYTGISSTGPARWHWSRYSGTGATVHLTPGTHTITLGVREPGTVVAEVAVAESSIALPPEQRHDVCVKDGAPVEIALPWQTQLDQARTIAKASRERLEERLAQSASCQPPMGITELDTPLFFADPGPSAFDRYFAASNYLMNPGNGLATIAVSTAKSDLMTASAALDQMLNDEYESSLDATEHEERLLAINRQYDAQLGQLCGPANTPADGMLMAIKDHRVDENTCFVVQTDTCLANAHRPANQATATCYSGALGEALLAIKAASQDVDAARIDWNNKQNDLDRTSGYCAELEHLGAVIAEHNEHMEKMRAKKRFYDDIASAVALGTAISTGGLSLLTVSHNPPNPQTAQEWSLSLGNISDFYKTFSSGVSLLAGLLGGAADIEAEREKWDELMQQRTNDLQIIQCWNTADGIRDQINLAQNRIERATTEFESAMMRMTNARREVHRLVEAGIAERARELDRVLVRPQHHYWLDEHIAAYTNMQAWAKRTTYLSVRAIEHDFQQATGLASTALDAADPFQLEALLGQLNTIYSNRNVWGARPDTDYTTIRLSTVLGIAPGTLGAYLATDPAIIRDKNGVEIGRGVRFSFTPDRLVGARGVGDRRAERLWGATGSVQVDGELPDTTVTFSLFKRATFFSRWADAAPLAENTTYQFGIYRPSQNLFASSSNGMTNFAEALQFQPSTVHNFKNLSESDLSSNPMAVSGAFAGQGLFGDYVVMFRTSGPDAIDLGHVEDVLLRFDYVSIAGGPTPGP